MRLLFSIVLSFCFLLIDVPTATAQFSGITTEDSARLTLSPRFPEPNESVTLQLNDYSINTNSAIITWYQDGEVLPTVQNSRAITFTVGELGTQTNISAVLDLPSGSSVTASSQIIPMRTDILIEANTITPPFYNGRSLPTSGSEVQVTALPFTGDSTDPTQYSYTWSIGDTVVGGGAQRGKNNVTFRSQFETETKVSVDVYTNDGDLLTTKTVLVPISNPELYFYEVNPLRGLLETAFADRQIFAGEEMRVRAVPYFFDTSALGGEVLTEWELNGQTINNPSSNPLEITLRRQGQTGSFPLGFHIRNLNQLLQGVEDSVTITY